MSINKLEQYIFPMLLFTVAVIPLNQEFTCFCVAVSFLAALVVSFFKKNEKPQVFKPWQQMALYILVVLGASSIAFSGDRFISSWNYLYVVGQYVALFYVLLRYGWCVEDAGVSCPCALTGTWQERLVALPRPIKLIGAFLAMSVVVSVIGIGQKFFGASVDGVWVDPAQFPDLKVRVYSTLVNPNILAGYLVLVIAYAVAFFNVAKGKTPMRLVCSVVGALATLCLLYTYSRGNWLACAAVLVAFCVLFCLKAFIPVLAGGALALWVGGSSVLHRLTSIGSTEDTSTALRMAYLKSTKWIIEEFPEGVGWYGYRFVYPTYNYYLADKSVIMYHCHNIFLNVLAELGPQGLLAFLVVWWGIFLPAAWDLAYHGRLLWTRALGRGYVLATVGIIMGGLTDHVYFNTQMGLLFWLMGGLTMLSSKVDSLVEVCETR